jgi:hypothetical protein
MMDSRDFLSSAKNGKYQKMKLALGAVKKESPIKTEDIIYSHTEFRMMHHIEKHIPPNFFVASIVSAVTGHNSKGLLGP